MKVVIYGTGAVGARIARQIVSLSNPGELLLIDSDSKRVDGIVTSLGAPAKRVEIEGITQKRREENFSEITRSSDVVFLTTRDDHVEFARVALKNNSHVVSVDDSVEIVNGLYDLNDLASKQKKNLVVGAGFSPGLSCVLARHASMKIDVVDEIHIAKFGTGGPECARQHHRALRSEGLDWKNQGWEKRIGGTGRELCWFPDPVGGLDCYQAELPEPLLLVRGFPELVRATARVSATRRDQATKWLPMLRKPHPEGMIGSIRVEVRGWKDAVRSAVIYGALDRPAVAAGTVAALSGIWAIEGRFKKHGAAGLSEILDDSIGFLIALSERGVKAAVFDGLNSSLTS